jgi:putative ABC transport system ATP-binding protein
MTEAQATAETSAALYELSGVAKTYGDGDAQVRAVDGIELRIDAGGFVVIAGPSGSGKTTLLQLLGALDRASAGRVLFEGRDLAALGDGELAQLRLQALGFVFQQFNLIPTLTARQNVEAALAPAGATSDERHQRTESLLDAVGLLQRAGHLPGQLSGGEQQRVAIARALANEPRVVLADEPTGNLDSTTGEEIVELLRSLARTDGRTVLVVTHEGAIAEGADRVLRLRDGRLAQNEAQASSRLRQ